MHTKWSWSVVSIFLFFYAIPVMAKGSEEKQVVQTMDVTCKDNHVARHVLGDPQAPCRRHGGMVSTVPSTTTEPVVSSDDQDDEMQRIAVCKDGYEFWANTKSHKGACKDHGGVASWDDGTVIKVHKSEHRKPAVVKSEHKTIMHFGHQSYMTPAAYITQDNDEVPRDFCMFSALYNMLDGEVYVDDVDEADDCNTYQCRIDLDEGGTIKFQVTDCGNQYSQE